MNVTTKELARELHATRENGEWKPRRKSHEGERAKHHGKYTKLWR